jgi:hypothetical protein
METRVDETTDGISRPCTLVPDAAPGRFSINELL